MNRQFMCREIRLRGAYRDSVVRGNEHENADSPRPLQSTVNPELSDIDGVHTRLSHAASK